MKRQKENASLNIATLFDIYVKRNQIPRHIRHSNSFCLALYWEASIRFTSDVMLMLTTDCFDQTLRSA